MAISTPSCMRVTQTELRALRPVASAAAPHPMFNQHTMEARHMVRRDLL